MDAECGPGTQNNRLCPRFKEGRTENHMLANSDPSYAPEDIVLKRHVSDGVICNVVGEIVSETQLVPERARNDVILCHVLPKCLKASLGRGACGIFCVGFEGSVESINIRTVVEV